MTTELSALADPLQVIALYPTLLPAEKRKEVMSKWPTELPPLAGKNMEQALHELVDYLNEVGCTSCLHQAIHVILLLWFGCKLTTVKNGKCTSTI